MNIPLTYSKRKCSFSPLSLLKNSLPRHFKWNSQEGMDQGSGIALRKQEKNKSKLKLENREWKITICILNVAAMSIAPATAFT